jgi:tRNA(adenine34) deaminase
LISEHQSIDSDKTYMQMALDLAQEAYRVDEVPVGAVLVKDGEILATGFNQREGLQDPTAHAELLAIRTAAEVLGSWRLTDTTLYVTLEPCAMCAGAIIQSRISRLVFGTWDPKAGACGSICDLTAETRFNHRVLVDSGVLAEDCRHLLQQFFQQLRETQPVPIAL